MCWMALTVLSGELSGMPTPDFTVATILLASFRPQANLEYPNMRRDALLLLREYSGATR